MFTINFSNGRTATADSLQNSLASIRETYPDAVAYQSDAGEVRDTTTKITGERVLVWAAEADSVDDDGARAIASITSDDDAAIGVGDEVEAGEPGTEDHDTGRVLDVDGDAGKALVGWTAGVKTWTPIADLRRVEAAR